MNLRPLIDRAIILVPTALLAWACDNGAVLPDTGPEGTLATETMSLHFTTDNTDTACGTALGVRVTVTDGTEQWSCTAPWAAAMVGDPNTSADDSGLHHVADCLFTLAPGDYTVSSVAVVGEDDAPLACCEADFVSDVTVASSMTSEFDAMLTCDLTGPGALDIYGWLNRPPVIKKLTISPSKFAASCAAQFLGVIAEDVDGDEVEYLWQVLPAPNKSYALWDHGPWASFVGSTGDYTVRVTVSDSHGASTHLDFPLHRVASTTSSDDDSEGPAWGQDDDDDMEDEECDCSSEPEAPDDFELP